MKLRKNWSDNNKPPWWAIIKPSILHFASLFLSLDVIMALYRFAYFSSPPSTIFRFPKYPSKHVKFSLLPLTFATMEAPPEGYRRNVGICLMSNHKKVPSFVLNPYDFGFRFLFIEVYQSLLCRFSRLRGSTFPILGKCLRSVILLCCNLSL